MLPGRLKSLEENYLFVFLSGINYHYILKAIFRLSTQVASFYSLGKNDRITLIL
ncbi:hypothetical protein NEOC95_001406 [Neochlamydia sp. AcF95]|nr:hypothetical protein [Neochlamydia sp. AcF95]